jgi:hypothetical protein
MNQKESCEIITVKLGMVNCFILKGKDGNIILIDCGIPGSDNTIMKKI